jgi:hypothetical protein
MIRDRALQTREKLVDKLPVTGELLRGSLLERTVRHKSGCPKCARGEGHQVYVLTVSYAGGRVRQFSVRRERVAEVRRWKRWVGLGVVADNLMSKPRDGKTVTPKVVHFRRQSWPRPRGASRCLRG